MMEGPRAKSRRRGALRRVTRTIALVTLGVVLVAGAAAVAAAMTDRSALLSWVPASLAEMLPEWSAVRLGATTSFDWAKARLGRATPPAPVSTTELNDYEFQLVQKEFSQGDAVVTVRLVHKPSGRAIPDAVVFARRIDMAPDGMATMTAPLEPAPTTQPGTYAFKTNLVMEGSWRLSLAAKVQGETGTVQNRLVLKAVP